MKLISILLGQSIQLIKANPPTGGIYMPDAVKALQQRYRFVQIPTTLNEFDPSKGITFNHGKFVLKKSLGPKEIVIDTFQIFNNGVLVNTTSYAEDADVFLDDVIKWTVETFGSEIYPDQPIKKLYTSQVEVMLDNQPGIYLPKSNIIGKEIVDLLNGYGHKSLPFEVSSLTMHFDITQMKIPTVGPFVLSRREGHPYSSNIFFSQAPLKTSDHLALLKKLEMMPFKK